jgi:hypothetical protein
MLKLNHREIASRDWKGLLDFACTIRVQVEQASIDMDSLTDKQLEDEIQKVLHGGSISTQHMPTSSFDIRGWLWKKKRWMFLAISATILSIIEHVVRDNSMDITQHILLYAPLYTAMCLVVALAVGATLLQRFVVFIFACGLCIPFFFSGSYRDWFLPGVLVGLFLAFAVGSSRRSRFVLFLVPFSCNYIVMALALFLGW